MKANRKLWAVLLAIAILAMVFALGAAASRQGLAHRRLAYHPEQRIC
jgi:hypothetical protein